MNLSCCKYVLTLSLLVVLLTVSRPARASVTMGGNMFVEDTEATGPQGSVRLWDAGVNLDLNIVPKTQRRFYLRFDVPLSFVVTKEGHHTEVSPNARGNYAVDLAGEGYSLNLQYGRTEYVSTSAQLVETTLSRTAFALSLPDLPTLNASVTKTDNATAGFDSRADTVSVSSGYRYKWLNVRGAYTTTKSTTSASPVQLHTSSLVWGTGGSYEILPRTMLTTDYNSDRYSVLDITEKVITTNVFQIGVETKPFEWIAVGGNVVDTYTEDYQFGTSRSRSEELFGRLLYFSNRLQFIGSEGNRSFHEGGAQRNVRYLNIGASYNDKVVETIRLGLNVMRTYESDPSQGKNINDTVSMDAIMEVTPRIAAIVNVTVNRAENRQFVESKIYDASGTLTDRAAYDDRPAGFTFFDIVNNDLYTKNSLAHADWSLPTHIEPKTAQYFVSKNTQLNMILTDTSNLALAYFTSASSEKLELGGVDDQNMRGTYTWQPNRRTSVGLSRVINLPKTGLRSLSDSVALSYRFFRGSLMTATYSRSELAGTSSDGLTGTLGLVLGSRSTLDVVYAASQLHKQNEAHLLKITFRRYF